MKQLDMTLYLVSDSTNMKEEEFLEKIKQACIGGVTLVQLREKNRTTSAYYELARRVKQITDAYMIPLIIDDRVDIAQAMDADGVHVGSDDMPVAQARKLLGPNKIIGATAKSREAALQAQRDGASYVGVGAIYPTTTKVKTHITSVETLHDICTHVSIPVVAIGGLHKGNCDVLKGSGIQGISVVSAIMKQQDCCKVTQELKVKVKEIIN